MVNQTKETKEQRRERQPPVAAVQHHVRRCRRRSTVSRNLRNEREKSKSRSIGRDDGAESLTQTHDERRQLFSCAINKYRGRSNTLCGDAAHLLGSRSCRPHLLLCASRSPVLSLCAHVRAFSTPSIGRDQRVTAHATKGGARREINKNESITHPFSSSSSSEEGGGTGVLREGRGRCSATCPQRRKGKNAATALSEIQTQVCVRQFHLAFSIFTCFGKGGKSTTKKKS